MFQVDAPKERWLSKSNKPVDKSGLFNFTLNDCTIKQKKGLFYKNIKVVPLKLSLYEFETNKIYCLITLQYAPFVLMTYIPERRLLISICCV